MAHNGNAAKWHFLPYITCGQAIPILKLKALEDRIVKKFPNSLNRTAYPRALYTSVQHVTRALHVHDKKGNNRVAGAPECSILSVGAPECSILFVGAPECSILSVGPPVISV